MCPLQNKPGQISIRDAFIQDRDIRDDNQNATKILINQANTIDLLLIFKSYNLNIDTYSRKAQCQFLFHKSGAENSASFYYYKDTNSFYCFGCKHGGSSTDFVSLIDGITKTEAAEKLLKKFASDPNFDGAEVSKNFITRQELYLDFSNMIREFIYANLNDELSLGYAEKISLVFDTINQKHSLDNDGLLSLIDKLKIKLGQYKCQ
jgi:hypothetical protein